MTHSALATWFFGPLVVLIALLPDIPVMLKTFRRKANYGMNALHRYLSFRLMYFSLAAVWSIIILHLCIVVVFRGTNFVTTTWLTPWVSTRISGIVTEIAAIEPSTPQDLIAKADFLGKFDQTALESVFAWLNFSADDLYLVGSRAGQTIVAIFGLMFIGYVLLPLILLRFRTIGMALLFLLVLAVAEGVEFLLTNYAPRAFVLPSGSILVAMLIGVIILMNTELFDWLFESRAQDYRACVQCHQEVETTSGFCPFCGASQPLYSSTHSSD